MATKSASPEAFQILQEIGVIDLPEGWDIVRVESLLCDERGIAVGVMYPGDHDPAGVPLIKAGDLSGDRINPRPEFRITTDKHHEYRRTELAGGELLISLVGDVGRCALVPPKMAGWNAARAIAVLRFGRPADAAFVRDCLMSSPLQHLMQTWSTTTVQATLNLKEIRQIPLPWPPKEQRDAIVHILRTLDDKIELNRTINRTLETLARATFKEWFVEFDPVRAKAEGRKPYGMDDVMVALFPDVFEDSRLGKIPRGWQIKALDQIADFLNGLALQNFPPQGADSLPVIKIAQLRSGDTKGSDRASTDVPSDYVVSDGDVLFSWSGSLEVVIWTGGRGALNQHLFKVSSATYPKWFVFHWVREHLPDFQAIAAGKATTMGHIQRHHLSDAMLPVPPDPLLATADRVMQPLLEAWIANALQNRTLAAIRDALLPKLISGEIQLKDAENVVEDTA
jgi:type I restriction enzyme S subunit